MTVSLKLASTHPYKPFIRDGERAAQARLCGRDARAPGKGYPRQPPLRSTSAQNMALQPPTFDRPLWYNPNEHLSFDRLPPADTETPT